MSDLEKMRGGAPGKSFEHFLVVGDVEYIVFAEYHNPEPHVGLDGGPEIHGIFRPSGEELDGHISQWVEDNLFEKLWDIWIDAEAKRLQYLHSQGRAV